MSIYDRKGSVKSSYASDGLPCIGFIEGMATVFLKAVWDCAWQLIQTSRSFSKDEEGLLDNHAMKESRSKEVKMTKMVKAKENALDAEIKITSSENAQSHQEARTKGGLLEEHEAIAAKMRKKRLTTKLVL
nr:uncharacterized protein [Tanacetum cinerariifolium]